MSDTYENFIKTALDCAGNVLGIGASIAAVISALAGLYYGVPIVVDHFIGLALLISMQETNIWPPYFLSLIATAVCGWLACIGVKMRRAREAANHQKRPDPVPSKAQKAVRIGAMCWWLVNLLGIVGILYSIDEYRAGPLIIMAMVLLVISEILAFGATAESLG